MLSNLRQFGFADCRKNLPQKGDVINFCWYYILSVVENKGILKEMETAF